MENTLQVIDNNPQELINTSSKVAKICEVIIKNTSVPVKGKNYININGWQALARANNCVLSASDSKREYDTEGKHIGYSAKGYVKRLSDCMIISEADGFVGIDENESFGMKKVEYAGRSMAQTRAMAKAGRSAFSFIVTMMETKFETTPFEEVPDGGFDNFDNYKKESAKTAYKAPVKVINPIPKQTEQTDGEAYEKLLSELRAGQEPNKLHDRWNKIMNGKPIHSRGIKLIQLFQTATEDHALNLYNRLLSHVNLNESGAKEKLSEIAEVWMDYAEGKDIKLKGLSLNDKYFSRLIP